MTADYLAHSTFKLGASSTCLIHAAAGGVGLILCQLAKRAGATVIATVSTEEKAALAKQAGADHVILYSRSDFLVETRRITGGKGVNVVYDSVGKDTFARSLDCLSPRGMLVLFGQSSGPVEPFDPQILAQKGSLFLTRPTLGSYVATPEELLHRAGAVLGAIRAGELSIRIGATFPLAEAAQAYRQLTGRATTGKVLLIPERAQPLWPRRARISSRIAAWSAAGRRVTAGRRSAPRARGGSGRARRRARCRRRGRGGRRRASRDRARSPPRSG